MYKISKYKTSDGYCPLDTFIEDLIKSGCQTDVKKIYSYIKLLETNGALILKNNNWAKKLNSTIYELRPKNNRILFFAFIDDQEFVLLHGFKKKTQKTPISELDKAMKEVYDYERRYKDEQ